VRVTRVAGTPSLVSPVASQDTLAQLEFASALGLVAAHAVSALGAAAVSSRRPSIDIESIREDLATVGELLSHFRDSGRFVPRPVEDLGETLRLLATPGSVLEGGALRDLANALEAMTETASALGALSDDAPRVAALAVTVPPAKLALRIERAIEPDGRVADAASPGLKRARQRLRDVRQRLIALLERLQRDLSSHQAASDAGVTLRGGRYVIPVRRDSRSAVRGIVHGESASGTTLFVEPAESVELGNNLNACEAEEVRETLAVLRALTDDVRQEAGPLRDGIDMCVRADDLYARARYALDAQAAVPTIEPAPTGTAVSGAVHPLIRSDAERPVPFDLTLADGARTVVVSGPNAGGKTVLLKAIGLLSAMAQSGVVPPVGRGTVLPCFNRIFADIGDHQSIEASLSTFSAHVAALRTILVDADNRSLVLLDEIGGGTDPTEGAALAGAVLVSLHARGVQTVATTHLGSLKELAAATDGIVNASLEFDAETLAPTYRFLMGKPGRSYAIAIARRLGLPDDVLARADALTPEAARSLEATLAELETREATLSGREADVESLRARLEADAVKLTRGLDDLHARERSIEARAREQEASGREQARTFLLEARRRVEDALGMARAAVNEATAKEARRLVEDGVRDEGEALRKLEEAVRAKGWKLRTADTADADLSAPRPPPKRKRPTGPSVVTTVAGAQSEIDLRGRRADEAEVELRLAIDAAVVADLPRLRVIHGKGTGALRVTVAQVLDRDPRVARHRLAPPQEGGSGVTVVEFRA
jgi:DNA mismatch repair protein MutS2